MGHQGPDAAPDGPPTGIDQLRARLQAGERCFPGLSLGQPDGLDLDLAGCDLHGSGFREARFGHARLSRANVEGCGFQQALLWGADLSGLRARGSCWQEADLSFASLQGVNLCEADLRDTGLQGTRLEGARLQGARLASGSTP